MKSTFKKNMENRAEVNKGSLNGISAALLFLREVECNNFLSY